MFIFKKMSGPKLINSWQFQIHRELARQVLQEGGEEQQQQQEEEEEEEERNTKKKGEETTFLSYSTKRHFF